MNRCRRAKKTRGEKSRQRRQRKRFNDISSVPRTANVEIGGKENGENRVVCARARNRGVMVSHNGGGGFLFSRSRLRRIRFERSATKRVPDTRRRPADGDPVGCTKGPSFGLQNVRCFVRFLRFLRSAETAFFKSARVLKNPPMCRGVITVVNHYGRLRETINELVVRVTR